MKLKIDFAFGIEYRGNGDAILGHEQRRGLNNICHKAVELFGGYTKFNTVRAWRDPDTKQVVTEAGCTISVFGDELSDLDITRMVQQIKDSLPQKAVAVTRAEVSFYIL